MWLRFERPDEIGRQPRVHDARFTFHQNSTVGRHPQCRRVCGINTQAVGHSGVRQRRHARRAPHDQRPGRFTDGPDDQREPVARLLRARANAFMFGNRAGQRVNKTFKADALDTGAVHMQALRQRHRWCLWSGRERRGRTNPWACARRSMPETRRRSR